MAVFAYRAARADGTTFDGQIEGEDEQLVRAKLESDGLLVFRLARRGTGLGVPGFSAGRWGKLPKGPEQGRQVEPLLERGRDLHQVAELFQLRVRLFSVPGEAHGYRQ